MSIASEISRLQTAKANIKTAIQAKGVTVPASAKLDAYDDYVAAIQSSPRLQNKTVTANGTVTADNGYDGLGTVTVNVSSSVNNQNKSVSPSGSQQVVTPDSGYSGLGQVTVGAAALQNKTAEANGTVTSDSGYYGLGQVTVNVPSGATLVPTAGDIPILLNRTVTQGAGAASSFTNQDISLTIPVSGTYRFYWFMWSRSTVSSSASNYPASRLRLTRSGTSSEIAASQVSIPANASRLACSYDYECQAGDVISIQTRNGNNNSCYVAYLAACVAQNPWSNAYVGGGIGDDPEVWD